MQTLTYIFICATVILSSLSIFLFIKLNSTKKALIKNTKTNNTVIVLKKKIEMFIEIIDFYSQLNFELKQSDELIGKKSIGNYRLSDADIKDIIKRNVKSVLSCIKENDKLIIMEILNITSEDEFLTFLTSIVRKKVLANLIEKKILDVRTYRGIK